MSKRALRTAIAIDQSGIDPLTGETLLPVPDTDRLLPKADGGTYTDRDNVRVLNPVSHMARHGTLRERDAALEELKSIFDDRVQVMKLALKINNQLLAYDRRTDSPHPETSAFLHEQLVPIKKRLADIDKTLTKAIKKYPDPLAQTALAVKGIGPITVAALTVYVDMEKATTPSALWQYVGLDRPSHERYNKNPQQQARREERGPGYYGSKDKVPTGWGGNKVLRTVLYTTAESMMKNRECGYRDIYDRTKARLAVSEKIVTSRNTQGKLVEIAWKDTKPCHRNGAALRAIMKHLLADYWLVGRTIAGLPTRPLYAIAQLGHDHVISPRERGWKF